MNRYRKSKWYIYIIPWVFVFCVFLWFYVQFKSTSVTIETLQTQVQKPVHKDPCYDLRVQDNLNRQNIIDVQQRLAEFQADVALEIELSKNGQIPVLNLMKMLKKHDATHLKIYDRLYSIPDKKRGK